jgi:hypothetical protein
MMDGEVRVESVPGAGATFIVELPAFERAAHDVRPALPAPSTAVPR